jgi:hypothetical protein
MKPRPAKTGGYRTDADLARNTHGSCCLLVGEMDFSTRPFMPHVSPLLEAETVITANPGGRQQGYWRI